MKKIAHNAIVTVSRADEINEAHRNARLSAEDAVKLAIQCGELLQEVKRELPHGQFLPWVEKRCEFSERTARLYMQAAEAKREGLDFSALRKLYGTSAGPRENGNTLPISTESKKTFAPPIPAPAGTPDPVVKPRPQPSEPVESARAPEPEVMPPDAPEPMTDAEMAEADAAADVEYDKIVTQVMGSDDRLTTLDTELKKRLAYIQTLEHSRNHYQREAGEYARIIKARDRTISKLEGELKEARGQIKQMRSELQAA